MIIKDLGMMYPDKGTGKRKRRFCLVQCSIVGCDNEYKAETSIYVNKGWGKYCKKCGNKIRNDAHSTHMLTGTKEYTIWGNIKSRCNNTNAPNYHRYGGRGIKLSEVWENDFPSFYEYIVNLDSYGKLDYSLDRIDNDKGYYKGNLRWADNSTQSYNQEQQITVGVNFHNTHKKFRCYVNIQGKQKQLGMFTSQIEAGIYRNNYIKQHNITAHLTDVEALKELEREALKSK